MPEEPTGPLTLGSALSLALRGNPELATFAWEIRARDAQILQASLLPNPQVGVEIEDFGGSDQLADFDGSDTTLQLKQTIELGGKRATRTNVASLRGDLARWDYEVKKLDVIAETTGAFVDVLAAQERVALTEELAALAQSVLDTTAQRVKAGKVSPLEETKANVALSTSRIAQQQALRELDASRRRLATLWGASRPEFERVEGVLNTVTPVPPAEDLARQISGNPDVARWDAEMEQRRAALTLEKAGRVPDLTLGGGVRYLGETDDHAFVVQAELPLPLFDRNQGRILEAQHRLSQGEHQRRAAETRVLRELSEAHRKLSAAFAEARGLTNDVLPGARTVFDASQEGYRQGKFGYLEVLDAQRTLFEARGRHIEALTSYQKAVADIERAVGMRIKDLKKSIAEEREVGTNEK
jgi:cobalt-zinc-cadmium efflux system outer membrane protein